MVVQVGPVDAGRECAMEVEFVVEKRCQVE